MRLSKIRLTGFKSFVDATPVPFPGGITAIVGPNGCGKSNIIDAVRWVMGESSARHLRGGSMADVIFSGSGSRKPVGQASIELVFDNSDGALGGQYASFSEISVRRQVNRDGQSAYYLNGTRCRRRDITDVFLGTGLGPRSYSIIEQGTISRLIEAKPEELRGYLEEAAGISLYKERRRETERRMRDTRENLERLEDVRDEVGRQLEKLAKQAETAERYRSLKGEERQRRAELLMLRIRGLENSRAELARELAERNNALESRIAEQRSVERDMESLRARHAEDSDALNEIQGRYYQIGSDIARIEQRISHRRELRDSSARELERNREALERTEAELAEDSEKKALLVERLATLEPELTATDTELEDADQKAREARLSLDQAREQLDVLNERRGDAERQAEVERARIEQLEARQTERQRRQAQLAAELDELPGGDNSPGSGLEAEVAQLTASRAELGQRLEQLDAERTQAREHIETTRTALDGHREALSEARARHTSLETLQAAALGADGEVSDWLDRLGLRGAPRLGEGIEVAPGWERALEAVLGDALQAIAASDLETLAARAESLAGGQVMLYDAGAELTGAPGAGAAGLSTLGSLVSGPALIHELLAGVHIAEDTETASRHLSALGPGQSVVTRDGRWFGPHWVRVRSEETAEGASVLARGREIEALAGQIAEFASAVTDAEKALADAESALTTIEARRTEQQEAIAATERDLAGARARQEAEAERAREQHRRREGLVQEQADLQSAMEAADDEVRAARDRLEAALTDAEAVDRSRAPLEETAEEAREAVEAAREHTEEVRGRRQDIALRIESAQTARGSLDEAIARLERQKAQLESRNQELGAALDEVSDSDETLEAERQSLLEQRVAVETELAEARRRLEDADAGLRERDQQRSAAEAAVSELREAAESARYRDYEIEARLQTQREQLDGLEVDVAAVTAALPETADEAEWETELERLDARIRRLGPINLAAIDEHRTLSERKGYLDTQQADLTEALDTLQTAIQRIDRETRARFRETFDKVNAGLQRLFPRLFGGGQAYLEMTDDDLLETGVTIMAKPPGKRITNIHLLSGGEKALAAVSLVFAIFELNPAPFCMLDEVDAPLDEANVGRFCDLLREMSSRVQFIVITHNKTTMESASHLAGVTMAEPGVSRLVAVDVEAAVEMAEADT